MNLFTRAASAAVALVALCSIALGAGTIPLSGTQQFDTLGRPLSGGLLYTFVSGTTTPQAAFQDQALSIPYPNPMTLDASGRVPFFYLADGNIKIRLSDSTGVTQVAADGLLVIGPSSGGGGGGGVDATSVLATGDIKARYGTGVLSGFVRMNGRTIGSATSGGVERANADVQALFEYLWTNDTNLAVSGGRGGTANADWLANKTITTPDMRGRSLFGMDDMGGAAASRLTTAFFGTSTIVLGAAGGAQSLVLTAAQIPQHTHVNTLSNPTHVHGNTLSDPTHVHSNTLTDPTHVHSNSLNDPSHTHSESTFSAGSSTAAGGQPPGGSAVGTTTGASFTGMSINNASAATGMSINNVGASTGVFITNAAAAANQALTNESCAAACLGQAHSKAPPGMVVTFYQKL